MEPGVGEVLEIEGFSEFFEVGVVFVLRIGGVLDRLFLIFREFFDIDDISEVFDILAVVVGDGDSEEGDSEIYLAGDGDLVEELDALDQLVEEETVEGIEIGVGEGVLCFEIEPSGIRVGPEPSSIEDLGADTLGCS